MPQTTNRISGGLRQLANVIKENHRKVQEGARTTLDAAIAAGDALQQAKEQHGEHGKWKPWVKEYTGLSQRTAQQYVQLAKHREQLEAAKAQGNALFSIAQAVRLIAKVREAKTAVSKAEATRAQKDDDGLDDVETATHRGSHCDRSEDDYHSEIRPEVDLFTRLTQEEPDLDDKVRRDFDKIYKARVNAMQNAIASWSAPIVAALAEKLRKDKTIGAFETTELKKAVLHRLGQMISRWEAAAADKE